MGIIYRYYVLCSLTLVSSLRLAVLEQEILQSISRRLSGDSYTELTVFNATNHLLCHDGGNLTFLVNERSCINNEELFSGKHKISLRYHCN